MKEFVEALLQIFSAVTKRDTQVCRKCKSLAGEVFCDRSLLGEADACVFEVIPACRSCGSGVPCYGHPCELADRIAEIRSQHE